MAMNRKKTTIVKSKPSSGTTKRKPAGAPTSLKPRTTKKKKY